MRPEIVQVVPVRDYTVYVYFSDGKIVHYDASALLNGEVFAPLKDVSFFMQRCCILNNTLAWDMTGDRDPRECADIDPDMLYSLDSVEEDIDALRACIL